MFIIASYKARTIWLPQVALAIGGNAKPESSYKRLLRFLKDFKISQIQWAQFVINQLPEGEKHFLSMDRTNWNFGKFTINFLVLGVEYQKVAVSLFFCMVPTKGN